MFIQKTLFPNHTIPSNGVKTITNNSGKTVAEYFAGIGLVRLGLEGAGWETVFANDYATEKYSMYASNFDDAQQHYFVKNIFSLEKQQVPETFLATASFPCTDLSIAGNQKGLKGQRSSAFWGFINILKMQETDKPKLILLENVNGWLTSNDGSDFRLTVQALNELGYACDTFSLDAIRFTPQSRPRVFVIGILTSTPNQNVYKLLARSTALAPQGLKKAVEKNSDLRWHILDIPLPPSKHTSGLSEIVEVLPENDDQWWNETKVNKHLGMMNPSHLSRIQEHIDDETFYYRTMYRRVRQGQQRAEIRRDDIAGCLRTARGGSSRQMLVRAGKNKVRMRHLTPREYARLQGVPDKYRITTKVNQALTGFGDAVCVPAITWIGNNILNPLFESKLNQSTSHLQ
ncbi:MAG: DNA (cytosine-5-)-methyltransferase [Chloroflexota bacterium]